MKPPSSEPSSRVHRALYRQPPNRSGIEAIICRTSRIIRNIINNWWCALKIIIAVAIGVSIAIAIVAAGEGTNNRINELLDTHGAIDLKALGVDLPTIR